jgi:sensor histidine kinase YesM
MFPIDLTITYISLYFLLPMVLKKRRIVLAVSIFLCIILILLAAEYQFADTWYFKIVKSPNKDYPLLINYISLVYTNLTVAGMAVVVKLVKDYYFYQREKHELEKQNLEARLNFLKSQVNPHFMFNTLNNISSLSDINPHETKEAIIKLSELMRYMVYETNSDKVGLREELEYVKNYISLQSLRIKEKNFVSLDIDTGENSYLIEPMLLIPFVENAFKHSGKDKSPGIWVKASVLDSAFIFEIRNRSKHYNENKEADSTRSGFGISNVKKRLDLLYPGNYILNISEENGIFEVKLIIFDKINRK